VSGEHVHELTCMRCDATTEAHLGPLRVRSYGAIPLSGGWVLDERDGRQDAWCPEHATPKGEA
jgi:hypothetical protein